MKLTADNQGRIASRELFPPKVTFDASRQPDGSIRLIELVPKLPPKAKLVRKSGRTYAESDRTVTNADVEAVMAQFP